MLKSFISIVLVIITFTLSSCSSALSGLQSYVDINDGYQFLYPNGWMSVDVKTVTEGIDIVYRDFIEPSENLSVIISKVDPNKNLADLGTPTDVGYRFMTMVNENSNHQRETELVSAEKRQQKLQDYYLLEYRVKLSDNQYRHNLASVTTKNGKLYTFNISTTESRWQKVEDLFKTVTKSFSLS
ncbi:MAG: photosystem II oxygen evolving complex protein PsbP [Cyanobacteria bacterium]|nr:photosystem II oxygen evolving complex protein PsbP [Cyanobacteria bacterium CG_2015-16_32_12]NCO79188.1 photosystem II oxygen evolving complex protein PsbP [Cyanobacteria bacterium CG_2015-22_32_23]NCQ04930.1 photosystem II oxygen evolving complex protein PsbP [Cyanobacteria bacterium CG_2015-09_32_10]NCQ41267.1 photosystem II oxygen evolving complex protein PsbP [Cyanobacteria bacterium CG_2015-04_32_10]NCS84093.1 photosystem II oxygen evolving complex protein PsbP [Cyanobacteria bacterium